MTMRLPCSLHTLIFLAATVACLVQPCSAEEFVRYVAPKAVAEGDGASASTAADWRDGAFWEAVQSLLDQGPVTVRFIDGTYTGPVLYLNRMGHEWHRLTLRGDSADGAVFSDDTPWYIRLKGTHHIAFIDLHFRGPVTSFPLHIEDDDGRPSHHILIERCTFTDMHTAVYGALGLMDRTHQVIVRDCTFRNVGADGRAHMVYSNRGSHHLYFYNNLFQDCTGEYVRFRNGCEHVEVAHNVFRNTEPEYNHPFVTATVYNDVNPGDEVFSSDLVIHNNRFEYFAEYPAYGARPYYMGHDWHGCAIGFGNFGFSHPDYHFLPTLDQLVQLTGGPVSERRDAFKTLMGIDLSRVWVYDNTYVNEKRRVFFITLPQYGATDSGWRGIIDIDDLVQSTPPPTDWARPE